jgi:hypothetical protein
VLALSLDGVEGLAILMFLLLVLPLALGLLLGMPGIVIALISKRPRQASRFLGYGALRIGVLTFIPIFYTFFIDLSILRAGAIFDLIYLLPSIACAVFGLLSVKLWRRKK